MHTTAWFSIPVCLKIQYYYSLMGTIYSNEHNSWGETKGMLLKAVECTDPKNQNYTKLADTHMDNWLKERTQWWEGG